MDTVIIIPARGGSTRIPRKNLVPLAGKPLLSYTLDLVNRAGHREITYVSTDDADIRRHAERAGFAVIPRPQNLASETASTESALLHALDILAAQDIKPRWVMTLEPTSPFRTSETLALFFERMRTLPESVDCLFATIERTSYFWRQDEAGIVRPLFSEAPRRGQERKRKGFALHEESGGIFLTRASALRTHAAAKSRAPIFGRNAMCISIDPVEGFDINTPSDLRMAEALVSLLAENA